MKLAIISFAREGSKRLPGKNTMLLNGKPLIWYTLQIMKYLEVREGYFTKLKEYNICEYYVLADYKECKKICKKEKIKVIWRDHPKEWDDNRLNQWAHDKIQADAYLLLQPTSPFRKNYLILEWLRLCIRNYIQSAYAIKQIDKTFIRAGSFFYYTKEQLATGKLNDENSLVFIDNNDIDIDTIEDFKKAEEYAKQNYS